MISLFRLGVSRRPLIQLKSMEASVLATERVPGLSAPLLFSIQQESRTRSFNTTTAALLRQRPERVEISAEEAAKFAALSREWWDEDGAFRALHSMNSLRIPLITNAVAPSVRSPQPLKGKKICDVGCGGGILTEPLARLGAEVVGLDPVEESISVARSHCPADLENRLEYILGTTSDLLLAEREANKNRFDAVVLSEVAEHVEMPAMLFEEAVKLCKPGGSIIVTTINRTLASYWLGIVAAENILRLVPKGTHEYENFLPPQEVINYLERNCTIVMQSGMMYLPFCNVWRWTRLMSINYAVHAIKRFQVTSDVDQIKVAFGLIRSEEPDGTVTFQGKKIDSERQENLLRLKDEHNACILCTLEAKGIKLRYTDVLPLSQFVHPETYELLDRNVIGVCRHQYRKLKSWIQMAQRAHLMPSSKIKVKWQKQVAYFHDDDAREVDVQKLQHLKDFQLGGSKAPVPLKREFRPKRTRSSPTWFSEEM